MNMDLTKKDIELNIRYIQNLPVVHDLLRKIDKLKRKNKELKTMVRLLTKEPTVKPVSERGQYIKREVQEEEQKTEENIKLIIDTSEEILDIESDETEVVNPQSECSVLENKWENSEDEEEVIETEYEEQAILAEEQKDEVIHVEEEEEEVEEEDEVEEQQEVIDNAATKMSDEKTPTAEGADGGESPVEDDDEEVIDRKSVV